MKKLYQLFFLTGLLLAGCDSTSNDSGEAGLSINMQLAEAVRSGTASAPQDETLIIEGSNGTLTITDIGLVVAEFELEFEEDTCDNEELDENGEKIDNDDCEEFELPPSFVDLPLSTGVVALGTDLVPPGEYKELEFEVEDLEDDNDNGDEFTRLFSTIRESYPDWPQEASMVVVGEFAHMDGSPVRPFKVYARAEIEIEMEFNPPLSIVAGEVDKSLTIEINPENWFKSSTGIAWDLSQTDFERTGDLLEFEFEMKEGFSSIKYD